MLLQVDVDEGASLAVLRGELDLSSVETLVCEVRPLVARGGNLEIDMEAVRFVDSTGLRGLLSLAEKPEEFRATLEQLGARHVEYGALPEHYPVVVDCLVDMLQTVLGADFTPQLRALWKGLLDTIAGMMLAGAEKAVGSMPAARLA